MEVAYVVLGWLLGMLSPIIVSRAKIKYKKNDLYSVLINELDEVQYRLVCTSYMLGARFGLFDRGFLGWCRNIYETYVGGEDKDKLIRAVDSMLNMSDEQMKEYIGIERRDLNKGFALKKTILTFSELNLTDIGVFSFRFQNILFELRARIINLNQEIERVEKLHFMTFDSSITVENHEIIKKDIQAKYSTIQDMMIMVVDKIDEIKKLKKY